MKTGEDMVPSVTISYSRDKYTPVYYGRVVSEVR